MVKEEKEFLVINPGSSSEKFSLYRGDDEIASLYFEGIEKNGRKRFICTLTRETRAIPTSRLNRTTEQSRCSGLVIIAEITMQNCVIPW